MRQLLSFAREAVNIPPGKRVLIACLPISDFDMEKAKAYDLKFIVAPCPSCGQEMILAQSSIDLIASREEGTVLALCNVCSTKQKFTPDVEIGAAPGASEHFKQILAEAMRRHKEKGGAE